MLCFHRSGPPANYFLNNVTNTPGSSRMILMAPNLLRNNARVIDVFTIPVLFALLYLFAKKRLAWIIYHTVTGWWCGEKGILITMILQVWVAREDVKKKLEEIPIPFSDVKNILEDIHFKDELTQSRCRGWLVFPSRRYLQADILFPGCEFDCRLTIRGRTGRVS